MQVTREDPFVKRDPFRSDGTGPAPDPSVLRELHNIDPGLYVIWRELAIDYITGENLIVTRKGRLANILMPCWHVCLMDSRGTHHHLFNWVNEDGKGLPLDQRVPKRIRADVGRHLDAKKINDEIDRAAEKAQEKKTKTYDDTMEDFRKANPRKLREAKEAFERGDAGDSIPKRDPKIVSYTGQGDRSTKRGTIPISNKEAGFEMPWEDESG
jgi:hypothetical protein